MPDETANLFEIMATTRSMRRLKPDPVPAELIQKILEAGVSAPSGGNMQRWRFLVVRDPKVKQTVGAYYKRTWDEVVAPRYRAGEPAPGTSPERFRRMLDAAQYLADHIHEAPVWIVPCMGGGTPTRTSGTSIYPAVQNNAAGGARPRSRCHPDDALPEFREGGGNRSRVAAGRALVCALANRVSDGSFRAGAPGSYRGCRL